MNEQKIDLALQVAISAVREAGEELARHYGNIESEAKGNGGDVASDIVTKLDGQTEAFLAKRFKEFDPAIGFRGEEFGITSQAEAMWLVDPIDGTSHFVRGLPFCTTMVALVQDGQVLLAVINDFVHNHTYWASKGKGAFMNGTPIHVSDRPFNKAVISFETNVEIPENLNTYLQLRKTAGGVVNTINSGFEFIMVASGKLDARIAKDSYGYDWDYAPGALLVQEAGGVVKNLGSDGYDFTNHDFIAANPHVYTALTEGKTAIFGK